MVKVISNHRSHRNTYTASLQTQNLSLEQPDQLKNETEKWAVNVIPNIQQQKE